MKSGRDTIPLTAALRLRGMRNSCETARLPPGTVPAIGIRFGDSLFMALTVPSSDGPRFGKGPISRYQVYASCTRFLSRGGYFFGRVSGG